MLICMNCYNKYDKERLSIVDGHYRCPEIKCGSIKPLVECDELIADTIIELNRKGYPTQFSCSGHIENYGDSMSTIYILFKDLLKGYSLFNKEDIDRLEELGFEYNINKRTHLYEDGKEYVADYIKYPTLENDLQYNFFNSDSLNKYTISFKYVYEGNVKLYKWALSLPDRKSKVIKNIKKEYYGKKYSEDK